MKGILLSYCTHVIVTVIKAVLVSTQEQDKTTELHKVTSICAKHNPCDTAACRHKAPLLGSHLSWQLFAIQPMVGLMVDRHPSMLHGHLAGQGHVLWISNAKGI